MQTLSVEPVDLSAPHPALAPLTYPRFRGLLAGPGAQPPESAPSSGPPIAFAVHAGPDPVGLALGKAGAAGRVRLLSLLVQTAHRRRGLGAALLTAFEAACRARGAPSVYATFAGGPQRDRFAALTTKLGWSAPALLEVRMAAEADWTARTGPGWARALSRLRQAGFSATPWAEISAEDRAHALALEAQQDPSSRVPVQKWEPHADPALSVALRKNGRLVGYILGETKDGQHHFTTGYVAPDLQRRGWLIGGLDAVGKAQARAYGPTSVAVFSTSGSNAAMIRFMRRRLMPLAPLRVEERFRVEKAL